MVDLGDIASIGQGLLGGATTGLDLLGRARRLQINEDEAERRRRAEERQARQDELSYRVKLADLVFKAEDALRHDPAAAPRIASVLRQFGIDYTPTTGLDEDEARVQRGRLALARGELPDDADFAAMIRRASRADTSGAAVKNLQEAYREARAAQVVADYERGALSREQASRSLAVLGKDPSKVFGTDYAADLARAQARGRTVGEYEALTQAAAPEAGLAPARRPSVFGLDLALDVGDLSPESAPPPRTIGDVLAAQKGKEEQAKITPLDLRRVAAAERQAAAAERRAGAAETSAETGRLDYRRKMDRDREVRDRVNAAIKTLEAQAVEIARKQFPDDPVKQRALTEWLQNRARGLAAIATSDKSAADLEAEIQAQVKQLRGDLAQAFPEAKPAKEAQWWNPFSWFSRGAGAATSGEPARPAPAPSRGLPARPRPTPAEAASAPADRPQAVAPEALKAARDSLVNALYPGRTWQQLGPKEKQQIADRLNRR